MKENAIKGGNILDEMMEEGLVTIDDVEVIKYGNKPPKL
ncbi:MAG: DUF190 domain-containing protein [Pelosinus sp.]|nr:DUF190 domain-containing protein [Pelosinus sp.]